MTLPNNMRDLIPSVQRVLSILDQTGYLPPNSIKAPTMQAPGTLAIWVQTLAEKDFSPANIEQGAGVLLANPRPPGGVSLGDFTNAVKQARRENVDRIPWYYKNPPADIPDVYGIDYQRALMQMAARNEPNYHQLALEYVNQIMKKEQEKGILR